MFDAVLWGLVQGLTEFLPVSSSGHLVLVPALLGREGPDLATSAMLHIGTLVAVVAYFRRDLLAMVRFDRPGRRLITLLVIATVPAVVFGLALEATLDRLTDAPRAVAVMLLLTGIVLLAARLLRIGDRRTDDAGVGDAVAVGLAQATALVPGISRSGMTIATGLWRGLGRVEAARFAFLVGIPAIAGAGVLETAKVLADGEPLTAATLVGMAVAGWSGYAAIAGLLRVLARVGLTPFGVYCIAAGALALIVL